MYRVLRPLEVATRGSLSDLKELSDNAIKTLLAMGAIAKVAAPPLSVLPMWGSRATKLEAVGITDADQFLATDDEVLASTLRINVAKVATMKTEVRSYLTAAPEKR